MHLHCIAGKHAVAPDEVRNQGFAFSRCRRCGTDMVRSNSRWRVVPKGFRVVWRRSAAGQAEISATQLLLDLPSTGRALIVASERARSSPSEMVILALLGLRYLMWTTSERVRTWLRGLLAAREPGQSVICLAPRAPSRSGMPAS